MRTGRPHHLLGIAVLLAGTAACSSDDTDSGGADRQEEVAARGARVMPFDLDKTTHHFDPTDTGLDEIVVADDPDDDEQIQLVREHLAEEAERFENGDYGDPAAIHGDDMPGLAELEANPDKVSITLTDLPDGARVTFTTRDPTLVDALHRWGKAQTSDHGEHADQHT